MADGIDSQELQAQMDALRQAMQGLTAATDDDTKSKMTAKKATADSVKAIGSFAKTVGEGNTEFKSFNKIIDTATDVMAGFAKAVPFLGEGLAASVKAVGEASKFVVNQLDATYKAFEDLGEVGGLTAKGMTGLNEQFLRSGMSLQGFQKTVVQNAQALARFAGSTGEGAEQFSKIVGSIATTDAGDQLRRLGIGADKIGETVAGFVTRETRLGRAQQMTQDQLIAGSVRYAKELDELSKLTGQNKDALQKQQDAALSEARFRAQTEKMIEQGLDPTELINFQTAVASIAPGIAQGIRDLSTGAATTDAAKQLIVSTGGAATGILDRLKQGAITREQAEVELQDALKRNKKSMVDHAQAIGNDSQVFTDLSQSIDYMNAKRDKEGKLIKSTQDAQIAGQDELTNKTVDAKKQLELMNRNMSNLGFRLLPAAATAVGAFTEALNEAVGVMSEKLGISLPGVGGTSKQRGERRRAAAAGPKGQALPEAGTATEADYKGLRLKGAEATAGGTSDQRLVDLAWLIQDAFGADIKYFSAFNDKYHMDKDSAHNRGRALDFVLNDPTMAASLADSVRALPGVKYVKDEYNDPSPNSTGGHIHAEILARNGYSGTLSGPTSGYRPNLVMHGTETLTVQPTTGAAGSAATADTSILSAQLDKLEELVGVMKTQVSISNKLLSYQG